MIHIKSDATTLKQMFNPLKAVTTEIRLNITKEGLNSCAFNPANTAMLKLELPKHLFMDYEVNGQELIGMELWRWNQILQYVGKKDIMDINIQMDKSAIGDGLKYGNMMFEDGDGFQDIVPVVDSESIRKEPKIPSLPDKTAFITIPTARFNKILKKACMSELSKKGKRRIYHSDYITFEVVNGTFITTSEREMSKSITKTTQNVKGEGKGLYALDELLQVASTIKSKDVNIEMINKDYPLFINFVVLEHGTATYMLAPRVESE